MFSSKLFYFFLSIAACPFSLLAQCNQDFKFEHQSQIDKFPIDYPDCTVIQGDIVIMNGNFNNVDGLSQITAIEGNLKMEYTAITDFSGFDNLKWVGGDFKIVFDYADLFDLVGFNNLDSVGQNFQIGSTRATNIMGFNNLVKVRKGFSIVGNTNVLKIDGFDNLIEVGEGFGISYNPVLSEIAAFEKLKSIGGGFGFGGNENIKHIGTLNELEVVKGGVTSELNNNLISPNGLNKLKEIGGRFWVDYNDSLENFIGMESLESIGGDVYIFLNKNLQNFSGLESLDSVGGEVALKNNLNCSSMEGFNGLRYIGESLLIDSFPELLDLQGLEKLNIVEGPFILVDVAKLKSLNGIENLTYVAGGISVFTAESLSSLVVFNQLDSLVYFTAGRCPSLKSIEELSSINKINIVRLFKNDSLINLSGLEHLNTLNGGLFSLQENNSLLDISALENIDPGSMSGLEIIDNPQLSGCNIASVCGYLGNNGIAEISGNPIGCQNPIDVINNCTEYFTLRYGNFYDRNGNGVQDLEDSLFNYRSISINEVFLSNLNPQPSLSSYFLEEGIYDISYDESLADRWEVTTQEHYNITFSSANEVDTVLFGLYPKAFISDLQNLIYLPSSVCNRNITGVSTTINAGTTIASGFTWLEIDEKINDIDFKEMPDTFIQPNIYGWYFDELFPEQLIEQHFTIKVPGIPEIVIGDSLVLSSYANYMDQNGDHLSATFDHSTPIFCSFDPNDKLVSPNRSNQYNGQAYTFFGEMLFYTIRFQNTGNYYANDVIVLDTLDENIDARSFEILNTSHPNVLNATILEDKYISFNFNNINLPDSSSSFSRSQGYVSYKVKPKSGLAVGTIIENTAHIYFDANPAIVTNTTKNILVRNLPSNAISPNGSFLVAPNPNSGWITLYGKELEGGKLEIYSSNGAKCFEEIFYDKKILFLNDLANGIYWIKLKKDDTVLTQKMILIRD